MKYEPLPMLQFGAQKSVQLPVRMVLDWHRRSDGLWERLSKIDAASIKGRGIYVIWHGGAKLGLILIGRGKIGIALDHWQTDKKILSYRRHGMIYCTWAPVKKTFLDGVHHYLQLRFKPPCTQGGSEKAERILVNAPWDCFDYCRTGRNPIRRSIRLGPTRKG